jgi:uncharacterized membrane protein
MRSLKLLGRILFGLLFIAAGVTHFVQPAFFLRIMPPYLPWHMALVLISGAAEILLGIGLMLPRTQRWAAWGLIALLIAVFPANLHMAMNPEQFSDISPVAIYLRLPLQAILIFWVYAYTRVNYE